jgi:hypothetical protein
MSKAIPLLKLCALKARTGTTLPLTLPLPLPLPLSLPLPCGRTIPVGAQSIRNALSPKHNTENIDFEQTRAERISKP